MPLNLDLISDNSAVALDLVPWLGPLEHLEQAARKQAPWHLWLDKFSYPWAKRCDTAAEHLKERMNGTRDRDEKRELRRTADSIPAGKTAALGVAVSLANNGSLAEHCARVSQWLDRLKQQHGDRFGEVTLALESRLILHLGRANALENVGLYCDHTTGLPLIPGTAVKGVVSTWACWASNETVLYAKDRQLNTNRVSMARSILGDNSTSGSESAGDVIFLGGFPLTPPTLGLDIVNPHYDADGRDVAPKPNTFLCIEPGTLWRFAFYIRSGLSDAPDLLQQTPTWIENALTQTGIGAKTAAGYGRFRPLSENEASEVQQLDSRLREQLNNEQTILSAPPEERPYLQFIASVTDWNEQIRHLDDLGEAERAHVRRFLASEEGGKQVQQWRSTRGGRRQIRRLEEAGLL